MSLPKLVATDLDNTLLGANHEASDRAIAVMRRVKEHGIALVGITGRGPRLLELNRTHMPDADYFVLAQGSHIYRMDGEPSLVYAAHLPGERILRVLDVLEPVLGPLSLVVENDAATGAPLLADPVPPEWPFPVALRQADRATALSGPILKAFLRSETLHIDEVLQVAHTTVPGDWCTLTEAGIGWMEVCPAGHDKGTGLSFVAGELGVGAEDVLVFGDARNDLPMMRWAGRSVAVANAHPMVLAEAGEVAPPNTEDGVAFYLERLLSLGANESRPGDGSRARQDPPSPDRLAVRITAPE